MPAKWKRIFPNIAQDGQIQAIQAKKHVTVFHRSPSAPGAGNGAMKAAFKVCASKTRGVLDRVSRNNIMSTCMDPWSKNPPGRKARKSKSKYPSMIQKTATTV